MDIKGSNRFGEQKAETSLEKKKVGKVVSGKVKTKKKSEVRKLTDIFISEDIENVKSYILMDVLVPAFKKALSDVVKNGVDMILYGSTKHDKDSSRASRVSYRSYYDDPDVRRVSDTRARTGYSYDDVVLDSRGEAEEVLERMDELIETYGMVSVADFYELVGVSGKYTDNKYGWKDIHTAKVVRVSGDGYMIKLPRVIPL